jgi:signal transduction histidine kinase
MTDDAAAGLVLPKLTQVTIYRIVVEANNNALSHAHATQLEVGMTVRSDALVVAVEDNGKGFEFVAQLPTNSGGRGLHNIQERARAIGAEVSWRSSRFSSGTRFELIFPLQTD